MCTLLCLCAGVCLCDCDVNRIYNEAMCFPFQFITEPYNKLSILNPHIFRLNECAHHDSFAKTSVLLIFFQCAFFLFFFFFFLLLVYAVYTGNVIQWGLIWKYQSSICSKESFLIKSFYLYVCMFLFRDFCPFGNFVFTIKLKHETRKHHAWVIPEYRSSLDAFSSNNPFNMSKLSFSPEQGLGKHQHLSA